MAVAARLPSGVLGLAVPLFLTMLPVTMVAPVLKEVVGERYGVASAWAYLFISVTMLGGIAATLALPALLTRVPRHRTLLLAAMLVNVATLAFMPLCGSAGQLLAARFVEGIAHLVVVSLLMSMAGALAPSHSRGRVMGMMGAALILGTACGAPIGGLIGQVAPIWVFPLGAALALGGWATAAWGAGHAALTTPGPRIDHLWRLLRRAPYLAAPYAFAFMDRFSGGVVVSSFVLFLGDVHRFPPAYRGGLLGLFLLPFALLSYPAGRLADRMGRIAPLMVGNVLLGGLFALYGVVPASWLPVLMVLSGAACALLLTPNLALCADLAPSESRAAAFAGFNLAGSAGFLCGPLAAGMVHAWAERTSGRLGAYQLVFALVGCLLIAAALVLGPLTRRLARPLAQPEG